MFFFQHFFVNFRSDIQICVIQVRVQNHFELNMNPLVGISIKIKNAADNEHVFRVNWQVGCSINDFFIHTQSK